MSTEKELARRGVLRRLCATEESPTQYRLASGPAAKVFHQRSTELALRNGEVVAATGKVAHLLNKENPNLPPRLSAAMYQGARTAADMAMAAGEDATDAFLRALPQGTQRRWVIPFLERGKLEFRQIWRTLNEAPPPNVQFCGVQYAPVHTDYFLL